MKGVPKVGDALPAHHEPGMSILVCPLCGAELDHQRGYPHLVMPDWAEIEARVVAHVKSHRLGRQRIWLWEHIWRRLG